MRTPNSGVWALLAAPVTAVALVLAAPREEPVQGPLMAIAGDYGYGSQFARHTLVVMHDSRFEYRQEGCTGARVIVSGDARLEGMRLLLTPRFADPQRWEIDLEFEVIRWDARIYLVPSSQRDAFCDAVSTGLEPRLYGIHGNFYAKCDRWSQPPAGQPEVPPGWRNSIIENLALARIIGVLPDGSLRLNVGSRHGLSLGRRVWIGSTGQREGAESVVQEVDQATCRILPQGGTRALQGGRDVVVRSLPR